MWLCIRIGSRCAIRHGICRRRLAFHALVTGVIAATATASAAFEATACTLSAAAYAPPNTPYDGDEDERAQDDRDYDRPPVKRK